MADRHLPTAPPPAPGPDTERPSVRPERRSGAEGTTGPGEERGRGRGSRRGTGDGTAHGSRWAAPLPVALALVGGLVLVLGVASLLGDAVRSAALVEVDRNPLDSRPSYSDAPAEAAAFFARRDTVRVTVPRDMTAGAFLSLYHLETNAAARAALRDQLGAVADGDVLREGDRVTLTITVPRIER